MPTDLVKEVESMSRFNPLYGYKLRMAGGPSRVPSVKSRLQKESSIDVMYFEHVNDYLGMEEKPFIDLNVQKYLNTLMALFDLYDRIKLTNYTDIYDYLRRRISLFKKVFDKEEVWDLDQELTAFICNSYKTGLIDINKNNNLFVEFIMLKKKLVVEKIKMVRDFNKDVMNYFGKPIVFSEEYESQKLKAIHAFLAGESQEEISKNIYSTLNRLRLRKEEFIMMYYDEIYRIMSKPDYAFIINGLLIGNISVRYFPNEMIQIIKEKIIDFIKKISSVESLESKLVSYLSCRYMITNKDDYVDIVQSNSFVFSMKDITHIQKIANGIRKGLDEKRN